MKIYLVIYDNGQPNVDNEMYTCAIFDDYYDAVSFCLGKGYEETGTKDLFKKKWKHMLMYYYLSIQEMEMNRQIELIDDERILEVGRLKQ